MFNVCKNETLRIKNQESGTRKNCQAFMEIEGTINISSFILALDS
jgi:hypothetical protein